MSPALVTRRWALMPRGSHCETSSWPLPTCHLLHIQITKLETNQVTARIPSSDKQLIHPSLHMKPNAQWEDLSAHPTPPQRNPRQQSSVAKWCCPHPHRCAWKETKQKTPHDCINKCQYLTEMTASFSRWLVIILLTQFYRRPAGVWFGSVDSESRTQRPQNIPSRNKFGKCSPVCGS